MLQVLRLVNVEGSKVGSQVFIFIMQGLRLVKAEGRRFHKFSGSVLKDLRLVHRFSGSVLQGLRLVKAEGSKESSQDFRFSVAGSETYKG